MLSIQHLFQSMEVLEKELQQVDAQRSALVQIFTHSLAPQEALALAQQIQALLPNAQIIGSSVSSIIYRGVICENETLITVEQYDKAVVRSCLISLDNLSFSDAASQIHSFWRSEMPTLLRLFAGGYYEYAHQLLNALNVMMPSVQLAGGMAGEVHESTELPFVFTAQEVVANALVFTGLVGDVSVYNRIHTSHEPITPVYTITGTTGRAIDTIEGQNAQQWLQRNLGFLSTKQYTTWEDIAANDPLVHFQLALTSHERSIRFVRYEESTQSITQYFSRLDPGTQFRISYTSPIKCAEECAQTCKQVQSTPMEQLFCYSCLFRKLYLKNCAQWELTPFHENPVSGVFLLGEFGYANGANTLLNGSCVLTGVGETDSYLQVDLSSLDTLNEIQDDTEGLLDFILSKQQQTQSEENRALLGHMISHENAYLNNIFQYLDPQLKMSNLLKYDIDKDQYHFDKLCLMKIENADILLSYLGPTVYYDQLRALVAFLNDCKRDQVERPDSVHTYVINVDTFAIACDDSVEPSLFIEYMEQLLHHCQVSQAGFLTHPFIVRLGVVFNHALLLEQAYNLLEIHKNSQSRLVIGSSEDQDITASRDDLRNISLIQYALANDKVIPYYQGIYNNVTQKIDCYEALIRIEDTNGAILTPSHFIDAAKKHRLYLDLNLKMFEAIVRDFRHIDCAVNFNLSAHDISSPRFRYVLRQRIKAFPRPENLTFEILEDEYFADLNALKEFIAEVRSYGAKVAVDDFGSGYSNLLEIMKIRPDYLKIDGQIIRDIDKNYECELILDLVSTLGEKLGIDLVAEYVETQSVQDVVSKYNVLRSQGYLFSQPKPFSELLFTT